MATIVLHAVGVDKLGRRGFTVSWFQDTSNGDARHLPEADGRYRYGQVFFDRLEKHARPGDTIIDPEGRVRADLVPGSQASAEPLVQLIGADSNETSTLDPCWRCRGAGRIADLDNLPCPKCGGSGVA